MRGGTAVATALVVAGVAAPGIAHGAQADTYETEPSLIPWPDAVSVSSIVASRLPLPWTVPQPPGLVSLLSLLPKVEPLDVEVVANPTTARATVTDRRGVLLVGGQCSYLERFRLATCTALNGASVTGGALGDVVTVRGRARWSSISVSLAGGDDRVHARDGVFQRVDCGAGNDLATLDALDAATGCEVVQRG